MRYITKKDMYKVSHYLGTLMIGIGIFYLIPIVVDLLAQEYNFLSYLIGSTLSLCLGFILQESFRKYKGRMRLKHGMIISSLAWLWAGFIGAIIMMMSIHLGFIDGFVENMSAWTGSGITMFDDVEILPYSILFLRSLEQWMGGIGVVVIVISVIIQPGTASAKLYRSEAREERIKPSISNTLNKTIKIYLAYTILGIVLYVLAGMPLFDAICNTFTTISTGGMSLKNANIGYYHNNIIYAITIILMLLGATSFVVHYKVVKTKGKAIFEDTQFKCLILISIVGSIIIYLYSFYCPMDVLFTVVSSITTTGASIVDTPTFIKWPPFALGIIVLLMLIGGSSGSTVGSIKLIRVITFLKGIYKSIKEIISPEGRVVTVKFSGRKISDKEVSQNGTYISIYMSFIFISWLAFMFYGYDPFKSLFDVISLQGNVGLSLGVISNRVPDLLKIIAVFNMWLGRLEIFPVIVLIRSIIEIFRR